MEGLALILVLAAGIVLTCVVLLKRTAGSDAEPEEASGDARAASFHAVEVRPAGAACDAVRAVRGRRFLSTEAPPIPLPDCKRGQCSCVYVHYDDRRRLQRRDVYLHKAYMIGERQEERRTRSGRRENDRLLFGGGS